MQLLVLQGAFDVAPWAPNSAYNNCTMPPSSGTISRYSAKGRMSCLKPFFVHESLCVRCRPTRFG
eukprot:10653521-Alexandrium_andersonii.AAC.1